MSPKILTPLLRLFSYVHPPIVSSQGPTPDKQLLSELAVAADQAMVATRSQDNTPRGPNRPTGESLGNPKDSHQKPLGTFQKRKHDPINRTDVTEGRAKRRRSSAASVSSSLAPGNQDSITADSSLPVTVDENQPPPPSDLPQTNRNGPPNDGIEVRIVARTHSPRMALAEAQMSSPPATQPKKASLKTSRGRGKQREGKPETDITPAADQKQKGSEGLGTAQILQKATHRRFDGEESTPAALSTPPGPADDNAASAAASRDNGEAESDNEAPETIAVSAGLDQARRAIEEAEKATKRQKAEEKRKRRERDLRLKIQAKVSKRPLEDYMTDESSKAETSISPDTLLGSVNTRDPQHESSLKSPKKVPLPLLLPAELLNAEPVIRSPTPPVEVDVVKSSIARKRKLLERDSKPLKDVQRGGVKIRVLPSGSGHLPPKASKDSKMLRESWLTGQRGPKGGIARRKLGGGFVRVR